jgi:4-amino-4-deoxy-L-arabinose transferase-like glycosyltransferase
MLKIIEKIPGTFFSRDKKRLSFVSYAFLVLLCAAFFTPGITTMPPTDRDEASFAQASKQMIETGNFTDIRLQDQPRYKKPIGIYWLQSASARVLSPHHLDEIGAYRAPSLVGATVAVLMTAALGSLLFSPVAGLLAAIMLAGCVLLDVEARLATTDAALLGSIMVAMYAMARAYLGKAPTLGVWAAFWIAVAVGVLIKGPLIFLPIFGVLLWLRVADKKISWFKNLRPALGIPLALALIAPWFVAISLQSHGAFMQQSAGHDMLAKLWEGQNRGALLPGMHAMALPLLFFPYILFAAFAIPDVWKNRHNAPVKFCLGWIVPMWIVFELSATKLPHYVLPAYPAIALLTAKALTDGFPSLMKAKHRLPVALIVGLWLAIGSGFAFFFSILPALVDNAFEIPQVVAGFVFVLALGTALAVFVEQKVASLVILTLGGLVFLPMTFGYTLPRLHHVWLSRQIVEAVTTSKPCTLSQVVSVGYHEPSLAFMAGTDTIMAKDGLEAAEALKKDSCRVAVIDNQHTREFMDAFASEKNKPKEISVIDGFDSGHGKNAILTVFAFPLPKPSALTPAKAKKLY